jgi:hypothetical protein
VTAASAAKFFSVKTRATAPPQKGKLLLSEFCEDLQKASNDPQIERRNGWRCRGRLEMQRAADWGRAETGEVLLEMEQAPVSGMEWM